MTTYSCLDATRQRDYPRRHSTWQRQQQRYYLSYNWEMKHVPSAEQLEKSVQELFSSQKPKPVKPRADSPYVIPDNLQRFEIDVPGARSVEVNGKDAADVWLKTPHPAFKDLCPEAFMHGNEQQRFFLASFLASVKDGAFS